MFGCALCSGEQVSCLGVLECARVCLGVLGVSQQKDENNFLALFARVM